MVESGLIRTSWKRLLQKSQRFESFRVRGHRIKQIIKNRGIIIIIMYDFKFNPLYKKKIYQMKTPLKMYLNVLNNKSLIYKENKKASGIYCWTNKINGKLYVGRSENITNRMYYYFSLKPFKSEILEYCNIKDLIKREQFYIDLLNPNYNIYNALPCKRYNTIFSTCEAAIQNKLNKQKNHPK